MASNTQNLNLYKKNPDTDGADTFNVRTMLNENWDKIDLFAGTVNTALPGLAKITSGSYVGTGTSGSANPNELTFPFSPKLVIILYDVTGTSSSTGYYVGIYVAGVNTMRFGGGYVYFEPCKATLSGNTLQWYSTANNVSAAKQGNVSSGSYKYIALG